MTRSERGQVLPLVALMLVVAGVAALLVGRIGGAAVARAQARTAADAAALAGAMAGRAEAASVAAANGARLVRFESRRDQTWVKVVLGAAQATARARRSVRRGGPTASTPARPGLTPAMQGALAKAAALLGRSVPISSGYRSAKEQAALYARRGRNPFPVARPGFSAHERGIAVDVARSFVPILLTVAARVGLCRPYPRADPVHFELC